VVNTRRPIVASGQGLFAFTFIRGSTFTLVMEAETSKHRTGSSKASVLSAVKGACVHQDPNLCLVARLHPPPPDFGAVDAIGVATAGVNYGCAFCVEDSGPSPTFAGYVDGI
jgi:hypothetical protein